MGVYPQQRSAGGTMPRDALVRSAVLGLRLTCSDCRQAFAELADFLRRRVGRDKAWTPRTWEAARLGLVDARQVLRSAYVTAAREMRQLRSLDPAHRLRKLRLTRSRFRTPAHVESFLEESRSLLRTDPSAALAWLDLAEFLVFWLPARGYSGGVVASLALRTDALRANALRVAGDLRAADAVFRRLRLDPRRALIAEVEVHAELASLEASLRQDQRRFDEADCLLDRAVGLYRTAGDHDGLAKALIKKAIVFRLRGQPAAALPFIRQAAAVFGPETASRRGLEVQHNLALCLCQLGEHDEAAAVVSASRSLYARFADPSTQILLAWLEGRIARGRGDVEAAEHHLLDARNRYLMKGLGLAAALVTLDLAEVYVAEGRTTEVQRLAEATVGVFAEQEVYAEVVRALALLQKAAAAERVSLALIARLRAYLERAPTAGRAPGRLPP